MEQIRLLDLQTDLDDLEVIERETDEYGWTREIFVNILEDVTVLGLGYEYEGKLVGFLIYRVGRKAFKLLNIAVLRNFRRYKIGTQLVNVFLSKLTKKRNCAYVIIRERYLHMQLFLKQLGFIYVKTIKKYYTDNSGEYAYQFQYSKCPSIIDINEEEG